MAEVDHDFNSSDIEFELPPSKGHSNLGKQSIAAILANADEDRILSKKTIKTLQFGRGAPGTIQTAHRWVERFNAFRQSTLHQDVNRPFTGDDLLRFLDSIIGKLKPSIRGKPACSVDVVTHAVKHLSAYGTFTYPETMGYRLTAQDGSRLQTWADDAVKSGRLIKGRWKKKVWLNFTIVSRMTKAWLDHHEKYGTRNWDLIMAKHLGVVLVAALGMRVGDVTRSQGYYGLEYLKYKDVQMMIEGDGEAKLENIKARIMLPYPKGKKDVTNFEDPHYFSPLEDSEKHMCIITLLITHALRHGLVRGTTVQEVLNDAIGSSDSTIAWLYPDRPVTAAILSQRTRRMDLEKMAHPSQMLRAIKEMGLISNILSPIWLHALRYGAAQDTAHLLPVSHGGFTNDTVRQTMGHAASTLTRGLTEMYVGKHTRETYNARSDTQYASRWGAKFSDTSALAAVKGPVSNDEIADWQQRNEPDVMDHDSRNGKDRARRAIRAERHEKFIATAAPEKKKKTGTRAALSEKTGNVMTTAATKSPLSFREPAPPIHAKLASAQENSNIDPRLLGEDDLNDTEVDPATLSTLLSQVLLIEGSEGHDSSEDVDEACIAMAAKALFGDDDSAGQQQLSTKDDFINHYSRINIINCTRFADQWAHYQKGASYEDSIGMYSLQGNSRESPTPILFECQATPQCPYSSIQKKAVVAHEALCSPGYVSRELYRNDHGETFMCDQCEKTFLTEHLLKMHIKSVHDFEQAPCPHGCEPEKIYTSKKTMDAHIRRNHSGTWPARCLFPGCTDETKFKSSSYSTHLTKVHKLTTRAARSPYFPPTMKKSWQATACPVEDCTETFEYTTKDGLKGHLIKVHNYTKEEANELAACGMIEALSIDVSESHITRKARPKPWEVGKYEQDGEVDDEPASAPIKRRRR